MQDFFHQAFFLILRLLEPPLRQEHCDFWRYLEALDLARLGKIRKKKSTNEVINGVVFPYKGVSENGGTPKSSILLGTCPKAYRPTKRRINSLWPMGKVLYSRHHVIGIEYRICCGLAGLAFMCNNPFLFVFLFPWGQG